MWSHPLFHAPQLIYPRPKPRRELAYLCARQNTRLNPRDARFLIHLVQGTSYQLEASGKYRCQLDYQHMQRPYFNSMKNALTSVLS
jgi:hypothetical protein